MENNVVSVRLWDKEVGQLYWNAERNCAVFSYSPAFVADGLDIAPLTHSIQYAGNRPFSGNRKSLYEGLPEFVADSLPDRWGTLVFERWAEKNGMRKRDITPVDKLSFIGKRGMGALEFVPAANIKDGSKDDLNLESLYGLAKKIFEEREHAYISPDDSLTMQSLYDVGTSAGGKQPKAIIAINDTTGEVRSGQIMQGEGFDYYILKFADASGYPSAEIEQTYYEMACEAGIGMMPSRTISVEGRRHFLTRRFDREEGRKIFTQTLAAVNPEAESYADLFSTARKIGIPMKEQTELFRRMVFNVMAANIDDHSKNFSFMLSPTNGWHITPAYDLTLTTDLDGMRLNNRHEMDILGKTTDISANDLQRFAELNNIKNADSIVKCVSEAISHFRTFAIRNGVPAYWTDRIEEHLSHLVLPSSAPAMTGYKPTAVEDFQLNGHTVTSISLKENAKREFVLYAQIDGKPRHHVFKRSGKETATIREKGGAKMPVQDIVALISQCFTDLQSLSKNN